MTVIARIASARIAALILTAALASAVPFSASAQNPFGGFKHDESQPIEIAADSLEVREAEQIALFEGKVVAGQGTLRLTAESLEVNYGASTGETGEINRLKANGDVFIANGAETASGEWADYDVAKGQIKMGGGVTLTQGGNTVKGGTLVIDLNTGQGKVEGGRVKSVFSPAPKETD